MTSLKMNLLSQMRMVKFMRRAFELLNNNNSLRYFSSLLLQSLTPLEMQKKMLFFSHYRFENEEVYDCMVEGGDALKTRVTPLPFFINS